LLLGIIAPKTLKKKLTFEQEHLNIMKKSFILLGMVLLTLTGCKDATRAQWGSLGTRHRVTVWSGGVAVKTYISTGNVSNQGQSDGWYFEDEATHKLVEVAGTLTIEQL
jgi:hypothetical protein